MLNFLYSADESSLLALKELKYIASLESTTSLTLLVNLGLVLRSPNDLFVKSLYVVFVFNFDILSITFYMLYSIYLIKIDTILEVYLPIDLRSDLRTLKFCMEAEGIVDSLLPIGLYVDVTSISKLNLSSYARTSRPIVFVYVIFVNV